MRSLFSTSQRCSSSTGKQCGPEPSRCCQQRLQLPNVTSRGPRLHSALCRSAADESVQSLADLRVQMDKAIKTEDYLTAAKLRDTMQ